MIDLLLAVPPFHFLLLVLAAYRLTRLIAEDAFPLFRKPREWIMARFPPSGIFMDGGPQDYPPRVKRAVYQNNGRGVEDRWYIEEGHWLGYLVSCKHCAGVWVALATALVYGFFPSFAISVAFFGAIAGAITIIAEFMERN